MMGGSAMDDDWELASCDGVRTVVLIGRTGNGKSATGNSILGRKVFKSRASLSSVTSTCELQQKVISGQIINVIDTPGLFDVSVESEFIGKEIVKCISMANDGIHAVLVVLSVTGRFSQEEAAALQGLQTLFGTKITDYMIVVFTGGDTLEDDDETIDDYVRESPQALKEILTLCKNRFVLFDNKTKDKHKQDEQVLQLLSLVEMVIAQNGGQPYTNELFTEFKEGEMRIRKLRDQAEYFKGSSKGGILELKELMNKSYDEQLNRITEMVESKLKDTTSRLEKQLKEEQVARLEAEKIARTAQQEANDKIRELRENLEIAMKEREELRRKTDNRCSIL